MGMLVLGRGYSQQCDIGDAGMALLVMLGRGC